MVKFVRAPSLDVLYVDDSDNDILLVTKAFHASALKGRLTTVHNGEEAARYLSGEGSYQDRQVFPFPNMILTDLKMPGMDGFGLLRWLRGHAECAVVPTIVFSSSFAESDVRTAYVLGANAFLAKPSDFHSLVELMRLLHLFWSKCLRAPAPAELKGA